MRLRLELLRPCELSSNNPSDLPERTYACRASICLFKCVVRCEMKSTSILKSFLVHALVCIGILNALSCAAEASVKLADLDPDEGAMDSGAKLMGLPLGLHQLETHDESSTGLLVGVHGYMSRGYEWVYPLKTIDNDETTAMFFRWDISKCPHTSAKLLVESLTEMVDDKEEVEQITIVGHSLGGVLVSTMVSRWKIKLPTDFHVVAAPLGGENARLKECGTIIPQKIPPTIRLFQWRTQHKLDGAYKDLEVDPQVVSIDGSLAITLPETYRERRLGHNWSVSYVADRIASTREEK